MKISAVEPIYVDEQIALLTINEVDRDMRSQVVHCKFVLHQLVHCRRSHVVHGGLSQLTELPPVLVEQV